MCWCCYEASHPDCLLRKLEVIVSKGITANVQFTQIESSAVALRYLSHDIHATNEPPYCDLFVIF